MQTSNDIMKMHRCHVTGCDASAEAWSLDPDGNRIPGGWKCEQHAREVANEYTRVLGAPWTFEFL